jgi:hypothetical protein
VCWFPLDSFASLILLCRVVKSLVEFFVFFHNLLIKEY